MLHHHPDLSITLSLTVSLSLFAAATAFAYNIIHNGTFGMLLKYANGICGAEINAAAMCSIIIVMGLFRFYMATKCAYTYLSTLLSNHSYLIAVVEASYLVSCGQEIKWKTR